MNYLELLQGVVFYDNRGLPQKLFTVDEQSIRWTEKAFQVLALEHFIGQTLDLPQFTYSILTCGEFTIVITVQGDGYIACLSPEPVPQLAQLIQWLQNLLPHTVGNYPRFVNL